MKLYVSRNRAGWLLFIVILKMLATVTALTLYARVTNFSDSAAYTSGELIGEDWFNRTFFVGNLAYGIARTIGQSGAYFAFSALSAFGIWLILMEFPQRVRTSAFMLFFLPTVAMWTSIVGKESLSSFCLCLVLWWWSRWLRNLGSLRTWAALVIGLYGYYIIRPHYAVALLYLAVVTIALTPNRVTTEPHLCVIPPTTLARINGRYIVLIFALAALALYPYFFAGMDQIIEKAIGYFPNNASRANRHAWLGWTTNADFWNNAWWALPFGIIGPLPHEVVSRPEFALNFVEGLFLVLFPILHATFLATYLRRFPHLRRVLLFGVVPMLSVLALVHAPFGAPNPGSAVRYRAGFEYLLTIPFIMLWVVARYPTGPSQWLTSRSAPPTPAPNRAA